LIVDAPTTPNSATKRGRPEGTKGGRKHKGKDFNPFVSENGMPSGMVTRHKKELHKPVDSVTFVKRAGGELAQTEAAGFWTEKTVDCTKFIKIFAQGIKNLRGLSSAGTTVFEHLAHMMQQNISKDQVLLNYQLVNHDITPMSESTYNRGISNLIENEFIYPSTITNIYWINPAFVWNGDRLIFVEDYVKAGSSAEQAREQARKARAAAQQTQQAQQQALYGLEGAREIENV